MLVYRVEDEDNVGPYQDHSRNSRAFDLCCDHTDRKHLSPPRDPLLIGIAPHEKCGCASPEALMTWFDTWLDDLAEYGFFVAVYRDEYARVGLHGQVVFDGEHAQFVERHTLTDFIKKFA